MNSITQEDFETLVGRSEAFYVTATGVTNGGATVLFAECSEADADALRAAFAMMLAERAAKVTAAALVAKAERAAVIIDELDASVKLLAVADYERRGVPVEAAIAARAEAARLAEEARLAGEAGALLAQANALANAGDP